MREGSVDRVRGWILLGKIWTHSYTPGKGRNNNKDKLLTMANVLIEKETIYAEEVDKYNKNYAKAMDEEDFLEIAISSALYDNVVIEEYYYMQQAKKYHLELQRLAGKKVVDKLNLYQYNYNGTLVGEKGAK